MSRPAPVPGLLSALGWTAAWVVLTPLLLPPLPAYRTCVAGVAVLLFALSFLAPRAAFVFALVWVSVAGVSALLFGLPEPAMAGPIPAAAYLAGSALRGIYEIGAPAPNAPLLPAWRAWVVAAGASAVSAVVGLRTAYLLARHVPPPHVVNVLGEDVSQSTTGVVSALAALALAVGFHRATASLSRDARGRRAVDVALVAAALVAGIVALLQKLELLPLWRAARWHEWNRAQATFSDPSAAGVAAALLVAPLLARAATGPAFLRIASGAAVALVLSVLADAGSRAGFLGTLTASILFVLWSVTRLAAGPRPGVRRRVASAVGTLAILAALAFAAALAWPGHGAVRSALVARLEAPFRKEPTPSEKASERLLLYSGALALFREHPVVGSGLGSFRAEFPNAAADMLLRPVRTTDHPPSLYLGSVAETGLAGTALLLLLLGGVVRGVSRALALSEAEPEEALRAAGAGAATVGLLVVFLFGSHLVYPEIAALVGILTARLPLRREGRTSRLLTALIPVVLAGALVLLLGGVVARAYETSTPEAAFARSETAGVYAVEREPGGRPFRWTTTSAAFRLGGPPPEDGIPRSAPGRRILELPVKNARPDGNPVQVDVFWNDVLRGRVALVSPRWQRLRLLVDGGGVLRLALSDSFQPSRLHDARRLGIEVGPEPILAGP